MIWSLFFGLVVVVAYVDAGVVAQSDASVESAAAPYTFTPMVIGLIVGLGLALMTIGFGIAYLRIRELARRRAEVERMTQHPQVRLSLSNPAMRPGWESTDSGIAINRGSESDRDRGIKANDHDEVAPAAIEQSGRVA